MTHCLSLQASPQTATGAEALARLHALNTLARTHFAPREQAFHESARLPVDNLQELHAAGWLQATLPHALGGLASTITGQDNATYLQAIRTIARVSPGTAHALQVHNHAAWALYEEGTPEQHERFLRPLQQRLQLLSFAGSEPALAPGAPNFHTVATPVEGGLRVSGHKHYATNGIAHGLGIVFASLPDLSGLENNLQLVLVTPDMPGVRQDQGWWQPSGMRVAESPQLWLDDVFIPSSHVLGAPGAYVRHRWQGRMHLGFTATYLGTAEGALLWTLDKIRQTPSKRSDAFVQAHLGQAQVALLAAQTVFEHAIGTWRSGNVLHAELTSMAAKTSVANAAQQVLGIVQNVVGASGLFDSQPIGRLARDLQTHLLHVGYDLTQRTLGAASLDEAFDSTRQK